VIPFVRLERVLAFQKIAIIEVGAAAVFNCVAVGLAWKGWGDISFAWAILAKSVTGAVLANIFSPWRIGLSTHWERIRRHLRFGIPYQGISFVSLVKDSIGPMLIGLLLGTAEMGYVNWATMVAVYPLLILTVLQRVYLPAFSRMQSRPETLAKFVEKTIWATNAIVAPAAILTLVFSTPITAVVFGTKWLVALPLLYVFWFSNIFAATSQPVFSLLNALGRSQTTLFFATVWMAGTWLLGAPLIFAIGAMGYAIATLAVNFTNIALFRIAQKQVSFRVLSTVGPVWLWASGLGLIAFLLEQFLPVSNFWGLAVGGGSYAIIYCVGAFIFYRNDIRKAWALAWQKNWGPASP
ncbi:MAG: oligosaccharide flippase family protein, partial [Terriglobia bacterium]